MNTRFIRHQPHIRTLKAVMTSLVLMVTGCATVPNEGPSASAWENYLHSSPFSYPHSGEGNMVAMLGHEIAGVQLGSADSEVVRHIRAVEDWASDYQIYLAEANEAYNRVYKIKQGWSEVASNTGMMAGYLLSKNRGFGGTVGSFFGEFLNEMYSRGEASRARAVVMKPIYDRALLLAEAEHRINAHLGLSSTNHLRRILGRY